MSIENVALGPQARVLINNTLVSVVSGAVRGNADIPEISDTEHYPYKRYGSGLMGMSVNLVFQYESDRLLNNPPFTLKPSSNVFSTFIIPVWNNVAAGFYYFPQLKINDYDHSFAVVGSPAQTVTINATGDGKFSYPLDTFYYCDERDFINSLLGLVIPECVIIQ